MASLYGFIARKDICRRAWPPKFAIRSCPSSSVKGSPFFDGLDKDVALHLVEVKAYTSGMVALRHEVRK
jgi:hypothetical protein